MSAENVPSAVRPGRRRRAGAVSSNTPAKIAAHERRLRALDLRRDGHSYREIARQLGWADHHSASRAVSRALRESVPREVVDEVRRIELERLDALFVPMFLQATSGNRLAVDRCLRIMERRAALVGLDAPIQVHQTVITEGDFERAIRELNAEADALESAGRLRGQDDAED
jgi:hypothetical protein